MRFPAVVSHRYLWTRKREAFIFMLTLISILGVAVGVGVLTIVMAIMNGFEHELKNRLLGTNSHIVVRSLSGIVQEWRELKDTVSNVPGVESVSAFSYNQALLRTQGHSSGILIRGVESGSEAERQLRSFMGDAWKGEGRELFKYQDPNLKTEQQGAQLPGIVLGQELLRTMSLLPGDDISLLAPQVQSSPFGLIPRYKRFRVVAGYSSGLVEYENSLAYVSLEEAQSFFKLEDAVSGLEVRVGSFDAAPKISQVINQELKRDRIGLFSQDWTETNKALWEALQLEKSAYFIVLLLIIIMASFSIVSTLIMIVLDKRRDIAVLRTLGATSRDISKIFRIQGAVIGFIGTSLGVVIGIGGCFLLDRYGFPLPEKIFPVSVLPVRMDWGSVVLTVVASLVICTLATLYPAYRASRIGPIEGLRV